MPEMDVRDALLAATAETLRPIARQLMSAGVPFGLVEARLRELFVEIAEQDFQLPGRTQTDSRVALLTGINRKEVRRIRSREARRMRPTAFGRNQAASLVSRWLLDRRSTDSSGRPIPIPYQSSRGPSFVRLAQQVTLDLPPRAILDELVRTGAAEILPDERVSLRSDAYVPKLGQTEKLAMLAEDPAELVETMLGNIFGDGGEPWLQRKVFYDNVGSEALEKLRRDVRRAGQRFLRVMDRRLARDDRDRNPEAPSGEPTIAGVGIYYYEAPASRRKGAKKADPEGGRS